MRYTVHAPPPVRCSRAHNARACPTHTHIRTHTGDHSKNVRLHARDYAHTLTHDHSRCSPPINIRTLLSYSSCGPDVRAPSVSSLPLPLLPDTSNVATSRPRSVCTCLARCVPDPCILVLLPRSCLLITFDRDSKIRINNQHRHQHRNRQQFQLLASKRKTTTGRVQTRQTRVTIARPSLVCVPGLVCLGRASACARTAHACSDIT